MTGLKTEISARAAFRMVLAAGLLAMLGANLPGHLSYDSVAQLYEGHFHIRETWGPALYAWVLGFFDQFVPGTALYVTVSGLLFFGSVASLARLRNRTSWLAPLAAGLVAATPQVLIYQAIVWKDVMFANCAVAGLICVAHAGRLWSNRRARWVLLLAALLLLAAASQVRQNGIMAAGFGALALGWIASRGAWRRGAVWAACALLAVVAVGKAETVLSEPPGAPDDTALSTGIRIVQTYDVIGAMAIDPAYPLTYLGAANPGATKVLQARAKSDYTGRRVDFLDRDTVIQAALNSIPDEAYSRQWVDLILRHPTLYLRVRWEDFRWVFAPPVIDWCLPVYVGVDAPIDKMAPLRLEHRYVESDVELSNYASWFLDTPLLSHVTYAVVSLLLAALFLWRRQTPDIVMAALQLSAAAFAASFFIISIACDYRYMYFTDLAALVGVIYAALDPSFRRPRGGHAHR